MEDAGHGGFVGFPRDGHDVAVSEFGGHEAIDGGVFRGFKVDFLEPDG